MSPFLALSKIAAVFCALAYSCLSLPSHADVNVVQLVADEWCPYTCESKTDSQGLMVDVAKAAFAEMGLIASYTQSPWSRSQRRVSAGDEDALLGADIGHQKQLLLAESFPVHDETVFVVLDPFIKIKTAQDLNKFSIGLIKDYTYAKDDNWELVVLNHQNAMRISSLEGEKKLLQLLMKKRIQVAVVNYEVAKHYLKDFDKSGQVKFVRPGIKLDIFIGFTRNARGQKNLDNFNAGFTIIKASGKLERIYQKYGLEYSPLEVKVTQRYVFFLK